MELFNKTRTIIIVTIFVLQMTMLRSRKTKDRKRTTQEYMVQIEEKWVDTIKGESPRFGFKYKGKLVSNVYLFEEQTPAYQTKQSTYGISRNMDDFKEFFAEKIIRVELREYATVRYYPMGNETLSRGKPQFGQWIIHRQTDAKKRRKKCWPYYGMDVQEAWSLGYTGFGIRVAVVDIGIDIDHPDLQRNIDKDLCHSFVDTNHSNVKPLHSVNYRETEDITSHGTMTAGLIAAEFGNDVCSAGIAFHAKLIALKVFELKDDFRGRFRNGYQFQVDHIPAALSYRKDEIDIYSCSFNLYNQFKALLSMKTVLKEGVEKGRKGKGSIYVFSAGNNKGRIHDCNMEALANSIYTITISSVGPNGSKPSYAIPCASTITSTYGEFKTHSGFQKLETTTHSGNCHDFSGTSASAALASGIFALTLQANPELTWRDLQYITILSSSFERLHHTGRLKQNAAGFQYDLFFGFGLVNATAMVLLAKTWKTVPVQNQLTIYETDRKPRLISEDTSTLVVTLRFDSCEKEDNCVRFLEHVLINLKYTTTKESILDIILCSPSGSCSYMLNRRVNGVIRTRHEQRDWNFTSVHFWGENPEGLWMLLLKETPRHFSNLKTKHLKFRSAKLSLFGTSIKPFHKTEVISIKLRQEFSNANNVTEWNDPIVNTILRNSFDADIDGALNENETVKYNGTNDHGLNKPLRNSSMTDIENVMKETNQSIVYYLVGIIFAVVLILILAVIIVFFCLTGKCKRQSTKSRKRNSVSDSHSDSNSS